MAEEQPKADAGGTNELAGLKSRVDELGGLFKEWEVARRSASRTRKAVTVVILLVIAAYMFFLYSTFGQVAKPEYQEKFIAAATKSLTLLARRAGDKLVEAARRLQPIYTEELRKQFEENRDEMREQLMAEVEKLSNNLADKAQTKLDVMLMEMAQRQKAKVRAAFPAIKQDKDLDMIVNNLDKDFSGAAYDVLNTRLKTAQERLAKVADKILKFLPEERRKGFADRMSRVTDRFAMEDLGGKRFLEEGK